MKSALILIAACTLTGAAIAAPPSSRPIDDVPATQPADPQAKHEGNRLPQVDRLSRQLDQLKLTDEQKQKISPLLDKMQQNLESVNADAAIPAAEKKDKMSEAIKVSLQAIKEQLTPEQVTQLKSLRQNGDEPGGKAKKGGKKNG